MDAQISFADSRPGKARIILECSGDPGEIERAQMYMTSDLRDMVESMSQWAARHAFFVDIQDKDALTALQATVAVLDILRTNGLLNLSDISTEADRGKDIYGVGPERPPSRQRACGGSEAILAKAEAGASLSGVRQTAQRGRQGRAWYDL